MCWLYSDKWAAGFFDGEGNVSIFRRQRGRFIEHRVVVQITQNDVRPLHEIRDRFGGTVSRSTGSRASRWRAGGKAAEDFMLSVRLYYLVKRGEIDVALAIRELIGRPGRRVPPEAWAQREALYDRFRSEFRA